MITDAPLDLALNGGAARLFDLLRGTASSFAV
jgi:hypothetical protein